MVKHIVDLARKEKVATRPPEIQMTWDITQVFQLWYDFPSSEALSTIMKKIPKCEALVLQLVRARAIALFRLDTSTRSGDVNGARLNLIRPKHNEWSNPSTKSVQFSFVNTKEVQLSHSMTQVSAPVTVAKAPQALENCCTIAAVAAYFKIAAHMQEAAPVKYVPVFASMRKQKTIQQLIDGARGECKWYVPLSSGRLSNIFAISLAICKLKEKPASARSASTSALLMRGYSMNKIKHHARWASEKTFIRFYKKEIAIAAASTRSTEDTFIRRYLSHALRVKVIRREAISHAEQMCENFISVMNMPIHILQNNTKSKVSNLSIAQFYKIDKYGLTRLANEIVRVDFPDIQFSVRRNARRSIR